MKVVIAKTHEQFVHCCQQKLLRTSTTPHITTVSQILNFREALEPIFFGDFWNLPGYEEMERALKARGIKVRGQKIMAKELKWGDAAE